MDMDARGSTARDLPVWDGERYAANTAHHRVHDDRFLAPLQLRGDEWIVDVGCGSGDLTAKIATMVPRGHVLGVEPQPSMLDQARAVAADNQSFVHLAAQDLAGGVDGASADVVVSRATLHWVPATDHPGVLAAMFATLRSGGCLRLEFGGAGNVAAMQALLDDVSASIGGAVAPWCFPDAGWYLEQLTDAGFVVGDNDVVTVAQRRPFDRAGLQDWIDSQATMAYEVAMDPAQRVEFRALVTARIDEMRRSDGTYDLTYVRLEALATRP